MWRIISDGPRIVDARNNTIYTAKTWVDELWNTIDYAQARKVELALLDALTVLVNEHNTNVKEV